VPMIVEELRADEEIMSGFEMSVDDEGVLVAPAVAGSDGVEPVDEGAVTAMLWIFSVPLAYAAPFLLGLENIIGLFIIGFALYEAWKINRHVVLEAQGPYRLGAEPAAVG